MDLRSFYCKLILLIKSCLSIIAVIYLVIVAIIIYIGPLETILVKHSLKKYPTDIIVSLTTTPYRIDKIKTVLDSIFKQSIKPTRVYVNIPYVFKRDNSKYIIPNWLLTYPNIIINRTQDYGPATKLIATLEKEHDPDAIIITVDDDRAYPRHIIRDLVKQYLPGTYKVNHKMDSVFTGMGINFLFAPNFDLYINPIFLNNSPSLVVIGASGVGYKRSFFKDDIFSLTQNIPLTCFLGDDLMISAYLLKNNVDIIKISGIAYNLLFIRLLFKELPFSSNKDALSSGANGLATGSNETNYGHCIENLPRYNKASYSQIILKRSKLIDNLIKKNNVKIGIAQYFYYYFLYDLVQWLPFIKKIIIATME